MDLVASTGAHASPVTLSLDPYPSLAELQAALNSNVQGYPQSADATHAAATKGTWSNGWLFNIVSGADVGAFGGTSLNPGSTPTYGNAGPRGGVDLAVGFDAGSADKFDVANTSFLDVGASDDLILAGVAKLDADLSNGETVELVRKGTSTRYVVYLVRNSGSDAGFAFLVHDGVDVAGPVAQFTNGVIPVGEWFAWMAVLERGTNQANVAVRSLGGGVTINPGQVPTTLIGSLGNAQSFTVGGTQSKSWKCAALYAGKASGAASGIAANLSAVILSFANAINAAWSATVDNATNKVTIANSFWPCSVDFGSASLRSLLGITEDFNYPVTAAQMREAVGGGAWLSGYLLNESSGDVAPVFGLPTLIAAGTPTYSEQGARGGNDKAIKFDSSSDNFSADSSFYDVSATEDLGVAWVWKLTPLGAGAARLVAKTTFGGGGGTYHIFCDAANFALSLSDGVDSINPQSGGNLSDEWVAGLAVLERATNKARIGIKGLRSGTIYVSAEVDASAIGSLSSSAGFFVGSFADQPFWLSALYMAKGVGACTGLSAGLPAALDKFAASMKSKTGGEIPGAKYRRMMASLLPPGRVWR